MSRTGGVHWLISAMEAAAGSWGAVLASRPSPLRSPAVQGEPLAPAAPAECRVQQDEGARGAATRAPTADLARAGQESTEPRRHDQSARRKRLGYSGLMSWQKLKLDVRRGSPLRLITLAELQQHCTVEDAWVALRGKVYSITEYRHYHPGGDEILCNAAGTDCTQLFDRHHRWVSGEGLLKKWCARAP